MDFQNTNLFNDRLNRLSGNLLPITDNSSFSIFWKIYSVFVYLIELVYAVRLISICASLPKEREMDILAVTVLTLVITIEASFIIVRIHTQTTLVQQLIGKMNETLGIEDENMRNIIIMNVKPMETPFKFYLTLGIFSVSLWSCTALCVIFERNIFYYENFKMLIFNQEPFSVSSFLLDSVVPLASNIYIFIKKASVDVYTTHLISVITSQYQYIALRLVLLFRNNNQQDNNSFPDNNFRDFPIEKEIKKLCWQHNCVIQITLILKKLLSINIFLLYVNNVIRFCFIGVMFITMSTTFFDGCLFAMYGSSSLMQFYILCACFQKLSEASTDITDEAFHEDWNRFSLSIKRSFQFMTMASYNMDLRIALFKNCNLSLPSFLSVLNQSYSIALLICKVK